MLYISSSVSSRDKIKEVIAELLELGFLNIELSGGTKCYHGIEKDLIDSKKKYGINFLIHNYFPPPPTNFVLNIASNDPYVKDNTFKFVANVVRLAKILEIDLYTIHPGFNKSFVDEKNGRLVYENPEGIQEKENTKEDFYGGINYLLKHTIKNNIKIGIENFFPFQNLHSFMDSPQNILEFLDYYRNEPNVGLLLDLGHLNVAAKSLGFNKLDLIENVLTNYPNKLFEIHISENDGNGDLHRVSNFDSWQIELVCKYKKILGDFPIVFEWRSSPNNDIYQHFMLLNKLLLGSIG